MFKMRYLLEKTWENVEKWAALMRQYRGTEESDRDILLKLIDRIEVSEGYTVNGRKERKIRICYKFVGDIG